MGMEGLEAHNQKYQQVKQAAEERLAAAQRDYELAEDNRQAERVTGKERIENAKTAYKNAVAHEDKLSKSVLAAQTDEQKKHALKLKLAHEAKELATKAQVAEEEA